MIKEFFDDVRNRVSAFVSASVERVKKFFNSDASEQESSADAPALPAEREENYRLDEQGNLMVEDTPAQNAPQQETQTPQIVQAFDELMDNNQHGGLVNEDAYPKDFQATEFPQLAQDGRASMLGNNQAFFFVKNTDGTPDGMELNTDKLKTLMENVRENGTEFTLMLDADVTENPEKFVEKYKELRPEHAEDPKLAEAMLAKEANLIGDFIKSDGLQNLVDEVFADRGNAPEAGHEQLRKGFLGKQFKIEGVQTEEALTEAVWQVDAPDSERQLIARQSYSPATDSSERKWLLGNKEQVQALATDQNEDKQAAAEALLQAVDKMENLPRVSLTPPSQDIGKGHSR
ncbi:MAG: hypothetical protein MK052_11180 [Alphaproteobacteria bacterium]|nr:hypothetical protein [Alphaproteobacteria bacterium]